MRNLMVRSSNFGLAGNPGSVFESFFGTDWDCSSGGFFNPAADVRETPENVEMTFEIPGMDKGDIKLWVEDGVMTVSGERKSRKEEKEPNCLFTEIRHGSFSRSFRLPRAVDAGRISADYKNGLLVISIPRSEEAKPKEIEIKIT